MIMDVKSKFVEPKDLASVSAVVRALPVAPPLLCCRPHPRAEISAPYFVKNVGNDKVGNLPHTFSSFQGVARDMNDSSEKVWGRFPTCPQQACGAGWKPAPHFFIVSGRR